jgi:adenylosuccinate synthase
VNGHVIVVDLGYGDAGKGTVVDWLCTAAARDGRPVRAVVRFNGGAQAAHHVLAPSGPPHPFAQFGSGTFTRGTPTFLSRFMLFDPLALVAEAERLRALGVPDPCRLVTVDRDALLTTPYHRAANQAREEARGASRHGSCGMGIGETASYALAYPADAPRAGDMTAPRTLLRKLALLRERLAPGNLGRERLAPAKPGNFAATGSPGPGASAARAVPETPTAPGILGVQAVPASVDQGSHLPSPEETAAVYRTIAARLTLAGDGWLARLLRQGPVVFEGAQGVLLDEWRGFHPYTTWSTTTFDNAEALLRENAAAGAATRLGVTRTYQTRHGPGPLPTEDTALPVTERHNASGRWQGPFRVGHLDAVTLRYARDVSGGVDAVALTHLDTARDAGGRLRICRGYQVGGRTVTRIEPGPFGDLGHQEALTARLLAARPVQDLAAGPAGPSAADWPDAVAEILRAPVTVCSWGPAASDKSLTGKSLTGKSVPDGTKRPLARLSR